MRGIEEVVGVVLHIEAEVVLVYECEAVAEAEVVGLEVAEGVGVLAVFYFVGVADLGLEVELSDGGEVHPDRSRSKS